MESPEVDIRKLRRLLDEFVCAVERVFSSLQWVEVIHVWEFDDSPDDDGQSD